MNDPITILRQDHREAEELLAQLEQSKSPGPQRRQTVEKLDAALQLHMEIEERVLYPIVEDVLGAEPVQEADIEHELAREGLERLSELLEVPGFGAALVMVKAGIAHHVKEEEMEMFPQFKSRLDPDTLHGLGDQVVAMKEANEIRRAS